MAIPAEFQRAYPIYVIAGEQPISLTETPDGRLDLRGWDFKKKKMTREAASWDDIEALQPGLPVRESFQFSEGDVRKVTKEEFDEAVARLARGESPT